MASMRYWLTWIGGMALGAALVFSIPLLRGYIRNAFGDDEKLTPLPEPDAKVPGVEAGAAALPVSGSAESKIRDFALDDLSGRRVVEVKALDATLDADAMRKGVLRIAKGRAEGIVLNLFRGSDGHVSLAQALGGSSGSEDESGEKSSPSSPMLDLGPFEAHDVDLNIALSGDPLRVHLDHAQVRVQRTVDMTAPRVFLSQIEGRLLEPDPLPNPIEIHNGSGVVDLGEGPLVDLRVRVCLARGELRLRIAVPTRSPKTTHLTADADRFMGHTALAALGVLGRLKDSLNVERAPVEVPGEGSCDD